MAIGATNNLKRFNYNANQLPPGKHSTHGLGRWVPTVSKKIDDAQIFLGPMEDKGNLLVFFDFIHLTNIILGTNQGLTLRYNEFITYNVDRIKMKYLFRCNFK